MSEHGRGRKSKGRKLPKSVLKKGHRFAKKLKGKPGIKNPFALGVSMAKKKFKLHRKKKEK